MVLRTPPALITLFGLLAMGTAMGAGVSLSGADAGGVYTVVMGAYLLLTLAWCAAVHRASLIKSGASVSRFALPVLCAAVGGIALFVLFGLLQWQPPTAISHIIAGLTVPSYFAFQGIAARQLSAASMRDGRRPSAFGIFLLFVYLPVGVWFLRRRIAALEPA